MSPVSQTRGASATNILLGCWLIASPWIFSYSGDQMGMWNSIGAGIIVALVAASRVSSPRVGVTWSWLNVLLGLWTIASPWIYGYYGNAAALWDCVATGIAIVALASWSRRGTVLTEHTPTATALR